MAHAARQIGSQRQWAGQRQPQVQASPLLHPAIAHRVALKSTHQAQLHSIRHLWHQYDVSVQMHALPATPDAAPADAAQSLQSSPVTELQAGTLIRCYPDAPSEASSTPSAEDKAVFLEVLTAWDTKSQSCTAAWAGQVLKLSSTTDSPAGTLRVAFQGPQLSPTSPLVAAFPGWALALSKQLPRLKQPPSWQSLTSFQVVHSLQRLEQEVASQPHTWCDGTGPGDAPLQGVAYQVSGAGELLALMLGARGIVMVQLYAGWDQDLPQPVFNPFVITLLSRAVADKQLSITMSSISNGLGLTGLISCKRDPWKAWAKHMASFGAQAALVAGSPYYQLLIGKMLGYKEDNIRHYIRSQGGQLTPAVVAAVDAELAKTSVKKPVLPWNTSSRGKKK